jgi:hypothetical protein
MKRNKYSPLVYKMYAEHLKKSSWPCDNIDQYVSEFKEEIYNEILERTHLDLSGSKP